MANSDQRPNPDRTYEKESKEDLEELYVECGLSLRETADHLEGDISYEGVRYWLGKFDIDRRQSSRKNKWVKRPNWLDDDTLEAMHYEDLMTVPEIREKADVQGNETVKNWMESAGIEIMDPGEVRLKRMEPCARCGIEGIKEREEKDRRPTRMDATQFGFEDGEVCHSCWMTLYHRHQKNSGSTEASA